MAAKFPTRKWVRLATSNYNQPGAYFITIVTHQRKEIFGHINNDIVHLSELGEIADRCWLEIPSHFDNLNADYHVIMPNHVHGIIEILDDPTEPQRNSTLGTIVNSYKSAVSKLIHERDNFSSLRVWQTGYYDHIIRDDEDFACIIEYINNNPLGWALDLENPSQC